jgi:hypothetical protein
MGATLARLFAHAGVTETTHAQARYSPLHHALFVALHAPTPPQRVRRQAWRVFLCPHLSFPEWTSDANKHVRTASHKPTEMYRFRVPHTGRLRRAATTLYPSDAARLTRVRAESGRAQWAMLVLEKDQHFFQLEDALVELQSSQQSQLSQKDSQQQQQQHELAAGHKTAGGGGSGFGAFADNVMTR